MLLVIALGMIDLAESHTIGTFRGQRTARVPVVAADANAPPANAPTIDDEMMAVCAPMRMLGPYPVLSLRFQAIPTPEQFREQQQKTGESGVALDFVVDTAANVNTINAKLATDLGLEAVGFDEGGVSAAGELAGGTTYLLGTAQLNDLPKEERCDFLSNLTASALPVASPSGAGLLGIGFLFAFPGGVSDTRDQTAGLAPHVCYS